MKSKTSIYELLRLRSISPNDPEAEKIDPSEVCSFSGYRPSKLPFRWDKRDGGYRKVREMIREEIVLFAESGVHFFQTGMARGIDLLCGELVLELRKKYPINLTCVVPCINQCMGWGAEDQETYFRLIKAATNVVQVTGESYSNGCMLKRDRYLVDTAQYMIAVFDGKKGGTMFTINYARQQKRTIIVLNPSDHSRTELVHGNEEGVLYV
ncbi:MAG: DUF1273 domain-containing protein [Bacteroides sp.]|nr:DUF1273 domain-containing protein [Eubacterium sp.]MCM1417276.1 DUF1273 domain-containing protein [Roseburia sp.]MCM1461104.1 DUF1273 domain-containing protein [Bacteroides sp.]